MLRKGLLFFAIVSLVCVSLFPYIAFSHSLWINVTEHAPVFSQKFGAQTKTYLGYGHRYPVDDFLPLDSLAEYAVITPDGRKKKITPVGNTGFLESALRFKEQGQYVIAVSTKPGFYTMYADAGMIHHRLGPKTGLNGVILSLYYEQYAKSLINVGIMEDNGFKRPVGHKLEIIPLENPFKLKGDGGHIMSLKVLFNGEPAKYCKVYSTYDGFATNDDFAYATSTDQDGVARIRLTRWGRWLIKANLKVSAPEDMKDKCNELNYTATLTFFIP